MEDTVVSPSAAANDDLVAVLKKLIQEKEYKRAIEVLKIDKTIVDDPAFMENTAIRIYHEVCVKQLSEINYREHMECYECAEELLKIVAIHGPPEELLLELLEIIEEHNSDNVVTTALKALQIILLKLMEYKPRTLEWSLHSIYTRAQEISLPKYLYEGYDLKQMRLLEQNKSIQRFLINSITVGLFYEPLQAKIKCLKGECKETLSCVGPELGDIFCCFLVQMLGKPFALLDLSRTKDKNSNLYTIQCAENLTTAITDCIVDPLYFLSLVDERIHLQCHGDDKRDMLENNEENIFLNENKLPLVGVAIYYYMVFVEQITIERVPKDYDVVRVFEGCIHLVTILLCEDESALHFRGILLAKTMLQLLAEKEIGSDDVEMLAHKKCCLALCKIVGYSPHDHLRKQGVELLRAYILQFDDRGKYLLLCDLMRTVEHTGICGYLSVIYKDLVAKALVSLDNDLPSTFSGDDFRSFVLGNICFLPDGIETDLVDHADKVISSLNALRFFALKDSNNRTGFWNLVADIEKNYLQPLRFGLDMSMTQYKTELFHVDRGTDVPLREMEQIQLEQLGVNIVNEGADKGASKIDMKFDRKKKMDILNRSICLIDLMRSLVARATECVEHSQKNFLKSKAFANQNLTIV